MANENLRTLIVLGEQQSASQLSDGTKSEFDEVFHYWVTDVSSASALDELQKTLSEETQEKLRYVFVLLPSVSEALRQSLNDVITFLGRRPSQTYVTIIDAPESSLNPEGEDRQTLYGQIQKALHIPRSIS